MKKDGQIIKRNEASGEGTIGRGSNPFPGASIFG